MPPRATPVVGEGIERLSEDPVQGHAALPERSDPALRDVGGSL